MSLNKVNYPELLRSELNRAMGSVERQTVQMRQIIEKISLILLKLDSTPMQGSQRPNETVSHYKISEAIFHMTSIVERYGKIKKDMNSQNDPNAYGSFEEYKVSSLCRLNYLKTISRRLAAVGEHIRKTFEELVDRDESELESSTGEDSGASTSN